MAEPSLVDGFHAYTEWRATLGGRIDAWCGWLRENGLGDAQTDLRLDQLTARLADDQLAVAFIADVARAEIGSMVNATRSRLEARRRSILEQLRELEYLRSKNRSMVAVMMLKVGAEKEHLRRTISSYQALRSVFSAHTNRLFTHLGMDALSDDWRLAREQMRASVFTAGMRSAMARFFRDVRDGLQRSSEQVVEISNLMSAMVRKFNDEHGLRLSAPTPFSMLKYIKEIDRLEAIYERRFNTLMAMLANEKLTLMQKFFETLASRARRCYEYANREADQWLLAIMAPMETQVNERQAQFRRRLESIKRVHRAIETLEERMQEPLAAERGVRAQIEALEGISATLEAAMDSAQVPMSQAA